MLEEPFRMALLHYNYSQFYIRWLTMMGVGVMVAWFKESMIYLAHLSVIYMLIWHIWNKYWYDLNYWIQNAYMYIWHHLYVYHMHDILHIWHLYISITCNRENINLVTLCWFCLNKWFSTRCGAGTGSALGQEYIEAETKWPTFSRRHFKTRFL